MYIYIYVPPTWDFILPDFLVIWIPLKPHEVPITDLICEAEKILNIGSVAPSKDTVREAHRRYAPRCFPIKWSKPLISI